MESGGGLVATHAGKVGGPVLFSMGYFLTSASVCRSLC